jgi:hypothetical protein
MKRECGVREGVEWSKYAWVRIRNGDEETVKPKVVQTNAFSFYFVLFIEINLKSLSDI